MSSPDSMSTPPLDPGALVADAKVVQGLYRLTLNRAAESESAVQALAGQPLSKLIDAFFRSSEFAQGPGTELAAGRPPWSGTEPHADLIAWAADALPLSTEGRAAVRLEPRSWARLYLTLATDAVMGPIVSEAGAFKGPARLAVLRAAAAFDGQIEDADTHRVRGWAVRTTEPETPVTVELWINGAFCAASVCDGFRRDVQDRFGGSGIAAFDMMIPEGARSGRPRLEIEVRPAGEPLVLGKVAVETGTPGVDLLAVTLDEVRHARGVLERLESRLPYLETRLSVPFAAYDAYRRAWPVTGEEARPVGPDMDVIVDIGAASDRALDQTVRALLEQSRPARRLVLIGEESRRPLALDLANRAAWRDGPGIRFVESDAATLAERMSDGLNRGSDAATVLLLRGGDVVAAGALAWLGAAFARSAQVEAVYMDEDVLAPGEEALDPGERSRVGPRLKPGPDPDLLAQTPYVGAALAFRRSALDRVGLQPEAGDLCGADVLLALPAAAVAHVPRVLVSSPARKDDPAPWAECVQRRLSLPAEPRTDILGADIPGAVRVRRPAPQVRAAIIIPTRDALDLLRPCVDSVLAHAASNSVRGEILIIDHESQDPKTLAYLSELTANGQARVMPHQGDFNWALMNNLAAAQTDAEVLVFLNNDTVVLSPDWLDELAVQAMRPEVGVVGCRLVYGDGAIQHAGFVAREQREGFLVHEGVGAPGSDPGYLGRHGLLRSAVAVTGACMAVRAEAFRRLGGFDAASFPVEGNDVDLCLRAQAEGLRVLYDPYATLYHLESRTRGFNTDSKRQARADAANAILWARWGERFGRDPGFNPHFDRTLRPFSRLRPPPAHA